MNIMVDHPKLGLWRNIVYQLLKLEVMFLIDPPSTCLLHKPESHRRLIAFITTTKIGGSSVGYSACLRHSSAEGPGFESRSCNWEQFGRVMTALPYPLSRRLNSLTERAIKPNDFIQNFYSKVISFFTKCVCTLSRWEANFWWHLHHLIIW